MKGKLRLKGSVELTCFTLEVDIDFDDCNELEKFLEWTEKMRILH